MVTYITCHSDLYNCPKVTCICYPGDPYILLTIMTYIITRMVTYMTVAMVKYMPVAMETIVPITMETYVTITIICKGFNYTSRQCCSIPLSLH